MGLVRAFFGLRIFDKLIAVPDACERRLDVELDDFDFTDFAVFRPPLLTVFVDKKVIRKVIR